MHEYSIINHDRASIGKWLGISALILAGLISEWIKQIYSFSGIEAFEKITVTVTLIYLILYWLFNNYIWKRLSLPNISGEWSVKGKTIDAD